MARRLLASLTPDLSPLRESRDYRLIVSGTVITGLGTQAALVALPYQVYVISHKPVLVGLLGLVELVPLVAASLFGGAWADRVDRRGLLLLV
jgi:MFS family permease